VGRCDVVSIGLASADIVAVTLSVIGAFVLRVDWSFARSPELAEAFGFTLLAAAAIKPTIFVAFGLYRQYWRHAGSRDVLVLAFAASTASVALAGAITIGVLLEAVPHVPRSIFAID
jgi:FlaA1/EpsC-like NDP-sugar epimerase